MNDGPGQVVGPQRGRPRGRGHFGPWSDAYEKRNGWEPIRHAARPGTVLEETQALPYM